MKHLDDQQPTHGPRAPSAAGPVLPPTRELGPSVGAQTCPPLAGLLETVTEIDRLQARAIEQIARLQVSSEDVEQTGVAAETWLAVEGRMTRTDRRMLATVADHLGRLPLAAREFACGGLSWSQLRTIVTMLVRQHRIRADEWHAVDAAIATAIGQAAADDPDEVVRILDDWLYARYPDTVDDAERDASDRRFLAIQPRLDGSGGRFWGDTDAVGLSLLDNTTRPDPAQLPDGDAEGLTPVGRVGRARHDNLMARLATSSGDDGTPNITTLLTIDYDTLVGLSQTHAQLLASLTGGRLRVSAPTARRLLADGFDTRLIMLEQTGQVLGVGTKTRITPEWLRDALHVRDKVCTHPLCNRAGITCHTDHAQPWKTGGNTDINNLALVCGPHNRTKERTGWKVKGNPDGTRTWHHPRSGLTITTQPTTRRLTPPDPPPPEPDQPNHPTQTGPSPPAGADPPTPF